MSNGRPHVWCVAYGIKKSGEILRLQADNYDPSKLAAWSCNGTKQTDHKGVKDCLEGRADVENFRVGIAAGRLEVVPLEEIHADECFVARGDHRAIRLNDQNGSDSEHGVIDDFQLTVRVFEPVIHCPP